MPVTNAPETVLLDFNPQDTVQLLLEPMLNYHNVFQRTLGIYEVVTGKNKVVMNHMNQPRNILQPKSSCRNWNPTVNMNTRPDEILITDYEVNGELCTWDVFDEGVGRNLLGSQEQAVFGPNTPQVNAIESAMLTQVQRGLNDSVGKVVWFSDPGFAGVDDVWGEVSMATSQEDQSNLQNMMDMQSGIWKEIVDYVDAGRIPYVDSNGGNASNNATLPANITDFFQTLVDRADPVLRFYNEGLNNPQGRQVAMIMVQPGLFKAYKKYLQNLGDEISHRFILEGERVRGVLEWDDYLIVNVPEWDLYDIETGRFDQATGMSRKQRAILTIPRNLTIAANILELEGFPGRGLLMARSNRIKDKGAKYLYYRIGLGASFAHEKLMVAAYNSSDTYATS